MLTWMAVTKFLKKVWVWLRHNWYAPFLVMYTIALWIFFRRKDAAYKVLETRNQSYKEQSLYADNLPESVRMVFFHGNPMPHKVSHNWLQQHWTK